MVPAFDPMLEEFVVKHEHGLPDQAVTHGQQIEVMAVDQHTWDTMDVVTKIKDELQRAHGEVYDESQEYKEGALKCYNAHGNPDLSRRLPRLHGRLQADRQLRPTTTTTATRSRSRRSSASTSATCAPSSRPTSRSSFGAAGHVQGRHDAAAGATHGQGARPSARESVTCERHHRPSGPRRRPVPGEHADDLAGGARPRPRAARSTGTWSSTSARACAGPSGSSTTSSSPTSTSARRATGSSTGPRRSPRPSTPSPASTTSCARWRSARSSSPTARSEPAILLEPEDWVLFVDAHEGLCRRHP